MKRSPASPCMPHILVAAWRSGVLAHPDAQPTLPLPFASKRLLTLLACLPAVCVGLCVQVLFYARLAGDICGRLAPHWLHLRSSAAVLAAGAAKAALLALLVPAMLRPQLVGGDTQLALLIAANWWMSGYINTGAYLLAPKLAAQAAAAGRFQRPDSSSSKGSGGGGSASVKARAGGIMALAFQMSCFAGLLGAWALQSWALAGWAQPLQESGVRFLQAGPATARTRC